MGLDAVGVFGGGSLTNEKAYLLGKFARVGLRTRNIDYNGRFCMSSAAGAAIKALGVDRGLPFPVEDIARADVILLVGSNPGETMPPLMQYFQAQRRARRHADRRRSAAHDHGAERDAASPAHARARTGTRQRAAAPVREAGSGWTSTYVARAHRRLRATARCHRHLLARAGREVSPACRKRSYCAPRSYSPARGVRWC